MEIIWGLNKWLSTDSVVTIGVFDGVHLGHKGVFQELKKAKKDEGAKSVVITFSIHPDKIIQKKEIKLLTTIEHRLKLFKKEGIDYSFVIPFNEDLKSLTPYEFSQKILVQRLKCKCLVMGFDSAIGKNREGSFEELKKIGKELGFKVRKAPPLLFKDIPISSTLIRKSIESGNLGEAWALLGRPFSYFGKVIKGEGRGKKMGFPTANVKPYPEIVLPPFGVYAARTILNNKSWPSVLNLGKRPTFNLEDVLIEVHLINYDGPDFYGQEIEIFFIEKLRNQMAFSSVEELSLRISQDKKKAIEILKAKTIDSGL